MGSLGRKVVAISLAALVLVAGCSGGDDKAEETTTTTTTTTPRACKDIQGDLSKPEELGELPADCAEALFEVQLSGSDTDDVAELSEEERLNLGKGTCTYAEALAESGQDIPLYNDLVASNSKTWDLSEKAVQEIMDAALLLCPEVMEPVLADNEELI